MNHITAMYLARAIQDDRLRDARKRRPMTETNLTTDSFEPMRRQRPGWATILRFPRLQPSKG